MYSAWLHSSPLYGRCSRHVPLPICIEPHTVQHPDWRYYHDKADSFAEQHACDCLLVTHAGSIANKSYDQWRTAPSSALSRIYRFLSALQSLALLGLALIVLLAMRLEDDSSLGSSWRRQLGPVSS